MATGNKSAEEFGYCFILGRKSGFGLVSFGGVLTTCSLTSSASLDNSFDKAGYETLLTVEAGIGLVCSMVNNFGTDSKGVLKVVGFTGDVIVDFDNLSACSMTSRSSEERVCGKLEGCEEAGRIILCFDNLPARALTSRFSGT